MSEVITAEITQNIQIAPDVWRLYLRLPDVCFCPQPGQFVNIYLGDASLLLPRPISVCGHKAGELTLVYAVVGRGTQLLSGYGAGGKLRVSTPLGNGFAPCSASPCILVGGGVGVPPLLFLAKRLAEQGQTNIRAVLGFRSSPFLADEFPCAVDIATDDGSVGFRGNAVALLEQSKIPGGTQIFACGPKPMLKALAKFCNKRELSLQVSLEERFGCGYGACVACVCKTVSGNRKVCEDGPVFDGSEVIWDE